jgi:hypothetical protein
VPDREQQDAGGERLEASAGRSGFDRDLRNPIANTRVELVSGGGPSSSIRSPRASWRDAGVRNGVRCCGFEVTSHAARTDWHAVRFFPVQPGRSRDARPHASITQCR